MSKWIPCPIDWCKHCINRYCCAPYPPEHDMEGGAKRKDLQKVYCVTYEDGEVDD